MIGPGARLAFALALIAGPASASAAAPAGPPLQHTNRRRFDLKYELPADLAGIKRVELWITLNGGNTWKLHALDEDLSPPVTYEAPSDGTYGFYIVLEDQAGNRGPEPVAGTAPQLLVAVNTREPELDLVSPKGGFFGPSRGLEIRWRAKGENLAAAPVAVAVSTDGGRTWQAAGSDLPKTGSHTWWPAAGERGVRAVRVRVSALDRAGNKASATSDPVRLDAAPPRASVTGPKSARSLAVPVEYEAADPAGSGVAAVRLYVSADGGASWREACRDEDLESPVLLNLPRPGRYGLFVAAEDRVGNVSPPPGPGTPAQLVVEVRGAAPAVRLLTFNAGGFYRGGGVYPVLWEAEGEDLGEGPVALEVSPDGGRTWTEVARGLPAGGEFRWTLPRLDTDAAVLRATAVSRGGGRGEARSEKPFVIDSTAPRSRLMFDSAAEPATQEEPADGTLVEENGTLRPSPPGGEPVSVEPAPREARRTAPEVGKRVPILPPLPRRARELDEGSALLAKGDLERAAELLWGFLDGGPPDAQAAEALLMIGRANFRLAERRSREEAKSAELLRLYDAACTGFAGATTKDPGLREAFRLLGVCRLERAQIYYRSRRLKAAAADAGLAAKALDRALATPPNSADDYYVAGFAYYILSEGCAPAEKDAGRSRARGLFEKALAAEGAAGPTLGAAHMYLAELAERENEAARALEHWKAALRRLADRADLARYMTERIKRLESRLDRGR